MTFFTRILGAAALAAAIGASAVPALAQNYPSRPITIIVPFAPGGGTDVVARAIAPALGAKLGGNVVVENVSGAAGNIAALRVARAAPDGYTLIMHNVAYALNPALYSRLQFDSEKDFTPITMVNQTTNAFVARKDLPVNNVAELVAWMKSNRARLAHPGVGSTGHIGVALLARGVGVEADFIPYRGGGPLLQDVIAGHVDIGMVTAGNAVEPLNGGIVKVVGITSKTPQAQLPNVPPLARDVNPIIDVTFWNALLAPAGTPKEIVDKIHAAFEEAIKDKALIEMWAKTAVELYPADQRTPAGAAAVLKRELAHWKKVISENKIEAPQ